MSDARDLALGQLLLQKKRLTPAQLEAAWTHRKAKPGTTLAQSIAALRFLPAAELQELAATLPPAAAATAKTVDASAPRPAPGGAFPRKFGKYELSAQLGEGGMGVVYKGWDPALQRHVAIKLMKKSEKPDDVKRFFREARAATALNHPNIVPIYEAGEHEGAPFMVMKFVEGHSLDKGRLRPRRAAEVLRDVASALEHAHKQGIVHRDLKPANLIGDPEGHVYVLDFGLARQVSSGHTITQAGVVFGTPAFMPPEMAYGGKADARSDVYMIGSTLYALLTGREPFRGGSILEVLDKVSKQDPVPPRQLDSSIPADLETIVLKCMEKEPARRYRSAAAAGEDLRRWLAGEPISARSSSLARGLVRGLARRRGLAAALAVGLVTAVVAGAWAVVASGQRAEKIRNLVERAAADEQAGNLREARDGYFAALQVDSRHARAKEGLARVEGLQRGEERRREQAARDAENLLKDRQKATRLLENARLLVEQIQRDEADPRTEPGSSGEALARALADLKEAVRLSPRDAAARLWYGEALDLAGLDGAAIAELREAVKIEPQLARGWVRLARALLVAHRLGGTDDVTAARRELDRQEREVAEEVGRCIAQARSAAAGLEAEVDRSIAAALADWSAGKTREALDRARADLARVEGRPGAEELWWLVGELTYGTREKMQCYGMALRVRPKHFPSLYARGYLAEESGDLQSAYADLSRAVALRPRHLSALVRVANIARDLRKGPEAARFLDAALEVNPGSLRARLGRALLHLAEGRDEDGLRELAECEKRHPRSGAPHFNIGVWLANHGRIPEAEARLQRAIQLDPGYTPPYRVLAAFRRNEKKYQEGLDLIERAWALDKTDPRTLSERIDLLGYVGRLDEALIASKELLAVDPYSAESHLQVAYVYDKAGRRAEALAVARAALSLAPPGWGRRPEAETLLRKLEDGR